MLKKRKQFNNLLKDIWNDDNTPSVVMLDPELSFSTCPSAFMLIRLRRKLGQFLESSHDSQT